MERARSAAWSGGLTEPLAALIPKDRRRLALAGIKAVHTALFFSIAAAILATVWDGMRRRPTRRTAFAGALVLGESAVYASNNQVCPLTPLAEQLGNRIAAEGGLQIPGQAVAATMDLAQHYLGTGQLPGVVLELLKRAATRSISAGETTLTVESVVTTLSQISGLPPAILDSYQKVDVSGSYRIHRNLRWYLTLENVLNQEYQAASGFPALPATVRSGVTLTFGGPAGRTPFPRCASPSGPRHN